MTEQKVIISNDETRINKFLTDGWRVVSVSVGNVTTTGNYSNTEYSKYCFVLEREKKE